MRGDPGTEASIHATVDLLLRQCKVFLDIRKADWRIGNPENDWPLGHLLPWRQRSGLGQDSVSFGRLSDRAQPAPISAVISSRPSLGQLVRIFNEWTLLVEWKRLRSRATIE